MKAQPCPCGKTNGKRQLSYDACCGRYLADYHGTPALDAETLMRSRYSAFVLENAEYLLATWDPSTRPANIEFEEGTKWLGLTIRAVDQPLGNEGWVEFVARSRIHGRGLRLHERSRFVRRDGRWFYVDGEMFS